MTTSIHNDSIVKLPASVLFVSDLNARKTEAADGIEDLAASILGEGLIENLVTVPELNVQNESTGRYGVVAGGRRCRALHLLILEGKIPPEYPVNCLIVEPERAIQLSLTENTKRQAMHPADEFEAFRVMIDQGKSIEDVAACNGVTPLVVQRRLKLANVHPELVEQFRRGAANLEQMMALAVVDDHERQKCVWDSASKHDRHPATLRHRLTETEVSTTDRRVKFVGLTVYEKAGGNVRRDLFSAKNEGFLLDVKLLEQLVLAKLERKAAKLRKAGHAWVEVSPSLSYDERARYGRVRQIQRHPTETEQVELDALTARQQELQTQMDDEGCDAEQYEALDDELRGVDEKLEVLSDQLAQLDPAQQALAGAIVFVNSAGETEVAENLLKPEDAKRLTVTEEPEGSTTESKVSRIHSAALMRRLTAQRTMALRTELAAKPSVALVALTHALTLTAFYPCERSRSVLEIRHSELSLKLHDPQLETSEAHVSFESQREALQARLPQKGEDLLDWLLNQSQEDVLSLLAFCVGASIQAVQSEDEPNAADALATAAALDMRRWWKPTAATYFGSVSRARILEVAREFVPAEAVAKLEKMKKGDLAQATEAQLATSGWLPERLRLPSTAA